MPGDQDKKPVIHTRKHLARLERERLQTRWILIGFITTVLAVIGLIGYGWFDVRVLQPNKPVARIGKSEILARDFEARVRLQRQQLLGMYSQYSQYQQFGLDVSQQLQQIQTQLDGTEQLGQTVLDQMIDEEIIRQEAAKRGVTVSEAEVDERLQSNFNFYPNGSPTPSITPTQIYTPTIPASAYAIVTITPTGAPTASFTPAAIPTEVLFPTATASLGPTPTPGPTSTPFPTATPYTQSAYEKDFQDTMDRFAKMGFSEAGFRQLIETSLLREKLTDVIAADIQPVQTQVWARHILVADEAIALATIDRLKKGEDFGAIAKEISQDTGSGANGGDLGWFSKGDMVAPFELAAFSLEPGVISDPVKSDFGWHIIQVIAKQDRPLTADEYQQTREKAFTDWLAAARTDYGVETFDFWKSRVPTEPNFITMATESANAQKTALAEASIEPIETPTLATP